LWARKTEHLSDEQWKKGFAELERRVSQASANNETAWPPTYAEFIGLCKVGSNGAYGGAYKLFKPALPVPEDVMQERARIGQKTCQNLIQLFD